MDVLTGAGHYGEAQRLLDGALTMEHLKPHQVQVIIAEAQVHATLALAAATALLSTVKFVGDSSEITDWAKAVQPTAGRAETPPRGFPDYWPPKGGDIWQDRSSVRWACQVASGYLACLARSADDTAEEIHRLFGPLELVYRPDPTEVECPF